MANRAHEPVAYCPIPMQDGSDCWRAPEPDGFANICTEHMHQIAKAWVGDMSIYRIRCEKCGLLSLVRDRLTRISVCDHCDHVIRLEEPNVDTRNLGTQAPRLGIATITPRTDVVYYLRFGERVKIGTTSNLPRRLAELPHDQLLAVEPGNVSREKARHREFAASLVPGQQEWFEATPALLAHAVGLRQRFGPPMAAWRSWITRPAA